MSNSYFNFKKFSISQDRCAMKVGTDGVLLGAWTRIDNVATILDIGTGTGLLALMLAQKSTALIDAIDCEEGSFLQSTVNVQNSPWSSTITVYHQRLQEYMFCNKKYDLIIANPPYFENALRSPEKLRTMARHTDSLSSAELIQGTLRLLNLNGRLCLILPYVEAQLFIVDAALNGLFCTRKTDVKPSPGKKAHRVLMELTLQRSKSEGGEFAIRNGEGAYSKEYRELTKDYYLNF